MTDSKKRIALKPHMKQIREWVDAGRTDEWIADALGTSASSVQSFRSRNDIYRRERGGHEIGTVFEGVLDHGERDGYGLWLDPAVTDDPIWQEHWAGVDAVVVKISRDSIVLEADPEAETPTGIDGLEVQMPVVEATPEPTFPEPVVREPAVPESGAASNSEDGMADGDGLPREQGRVKWFDPEKGYGFIVRSTGDDLFVHHSEVEGDPSSMEPNEEVEYEVGQNDRGPNARRVRLLG